MSHPFDASGKTLLELGPAEWLAFLGAPRPASRVRIISADLSTVTAMADQVVLVDDPDPRLLHVEFQAHRDESLPRRMLGYAGSLVARHDLPVWSVAVLLSSSANATNLTGTLPVEPPVGPKWTFEYTVVRLWQLPVSGFLQGSPYLLTLAMLTDVDPSAVLTTAEVVHDRLKALNDAELSDKLLSTMAEFLALRYDKMAVQEMVDYLGIRGYWQNPGVKAMLAIHDAEVRAEEARGMVAHLGTAKFGKPTKAVKAKLAVIADLAELEDLGVRLLTANSWKELFAAPK